MLRSDLLMKNAPRVELDHRAREARLRLERAQQVLMPRPVKRRLWFGWLGARICGGVPQRSRTGRSLSDQRPSSADAILHEPMKYYALRANKRRPLHRYRLVKAQGLLASYLAERLTMWPVDKCAGHVMIVSPGTF